MGNACSHDRFFRRGGAAPVVSHECPDRLRGDIAIVPFTGELSVFAQKDADFSLS